MPESPEFLVIGDVIPGHEDALRQVLEAHAANPRTQEAINQIRSSRRAGSEKDA